MFFYLSKLALLLLQPSSLCIVLLALGSALAVRERSRVRGARCSLAGLFALLFVGLSRWGSEHRQVVTLEVEIHLAACGDRE